MDLFNLIAPGKKRKTDEAMSSTQIHLRIGEIKDDTLVLKNGGARAIFRVSSINFNLKSEQEQNAIINGYQGFLNSLEFPIQIIARSKKLDIDDYIDQVREIGERQENELLKEQTFEYADYIKKLVDYADIMAKEFYVVIPYDPGRVQGSTKTQSFFQRMAPKDSYTDIKQRKDEFKNLKKSLGQRTNIVKSGLEGCGLKVEQLNTHEIIELFYNSYNPKSSRAAKAKKFENTDIDIKA